MSTTCLVLHAVSPKLGREISRHKYIPTFHEYLRWQVTITDVSEKSECMHVHAFRYSVPVLFSFVKERHHTHTHPFNGPLSGTTQVSRYQKGKTNLDFTEARDSEWQWLQLGYMQVCTSLQTDNHASTPPLSFLQAGCPSCRPTNSIKALKANAKTPRKTQKSTKWQQNVINNISDPYSMWSRVYVTVRCPSVCLS